VTPNSLAFVIHCCCNTTGYCQFGNGSAQLMGNDGNDEEETFAIQIDVKRNVVVSTFGIHNDCFFIEACTKLTSNSFFLLSLICSSHKVQIVSRRDVNYS